MTNKYPAEHAICLKILAIFERNFQITLRRPPNCVGSGGVIFDKDSQSRYFTAKFEAVVDRLELLAKTSSVVEVVAQQASDELLRGFYSYDVRRQAIMLILATPQHPPVVFTNIPDDAPEHPGQALVTVKFVVSFPVALPLGLPAKNADEAEYAQSGITLEKFLKTPGGL